MGKLADIFLQDAGKPEEKPEQLELLLTPKRVEGQENYLEEFYRFCLQDKQTIVVGRLDDNNLDGELRREDKVFIPSPGFIPSLAPLLANSQDTVLFGNIYKEYHQICDERHYHRISREHLGITRDVNGYVLKNLSEIINAGRISNPNPSVIVYDPLTKSSEEVHSEGIVLRDGAIIRFGYLPNPMTEYPLAVSVTIRDITEKIKKLVESFPFKP